MINLALILIGGISAFALARADSKKKLKSAAPETPESDQGIVTLSRQGEKDYDDVKEVKQFYKSSLYAVALVSAGSLFYYPIVLLGLPILGYNAFGFAKALKNSSKNEIKSPLVVFEMISLFATTITQHYFSLSLLLLFGFLRRDILLKTGGLINHYSALEGKVSASVWVLRDEVEIEVPINHLKDKDVVVGRAGETIFTEGEVVGGSAVIKQFCLKRKMKMLRKNTGDRVYPFTFIEDGSIQIRINR